MRIAIVGPTHPLKGGIAQHTTELAHQLASSTDHACRIVSWRSQGPRVPKRNAEPLGEPESIPFPHTGHSLHWARPGTWLRAGSRIAENTDVLILVMTVPLQFPALGVISSIFRNRTASTDSEVVLIAHNVLPHEHHLGARWVARRALSVADRVIVHSQEQATIAEALGAHEVNAVRLPLHGPRPASGDVDAATPPRSPRMQLAFFGFVRAYKGLEDLITALTLTPVRPHITVMGEFWEPVGRYRKMIDALGLATQITLLPGYAAESDVNRLLEESDALVLPYRSATGSQMPRLAFQHGLPVIATDVGDLAAQVRPGIDGLVCAPNDPQALASAIEAFYTGSVWRDLRHGVQAPAPVSEWADYVATILDGRGKSDERANRA